MGSEVVLVELGRMRSVFLQSGAGASELSSFVEW